MTRYFYDWEFLDTGGSIQPISVGIVCEDGRELYLVNEACAEGEFGKSIMRHRWLPDNVVPHLPLRRDHPHDDGFNRLDGRKTGFRLDRDDNRVVPLRFIRNAVRDFFAVDPPVPGELWGYFPAYDHVLLAQLWGPMVEMPRIIPMRTSCIAQYADMLGIDSFDDVPMEGTAHNALDDARWTRDAWRYLEARRRDDVSLKLAGILAMPDGTPVRPCSCLAPNETSCPAHGPIRCTSCEHERSMHHGAGCEFTVSVGTVGANTVCPCTVPYPPGAATATPEE